MPPGRSDHGELPGLVPDLRDAAGKHLKVPTDNNRVPSKQRISLISNISDTKKRSMIDQPSGRRSVRENHRNKVQMVHKLALVSNMTEFIKVLEGLRPPSVNNAIARIDSQNEEELMQEMDKILEARFDLDGRSATERAKLATLNVECQWLMRVVAPIAQATPKLASSLTTVSSLIAQLVHLHVAIDSMKDEERDLPQGERVILIWGSDREKRMGVNITEIYREAITHVPDTLTNEGYWTLLPTTSNEELDAFKEEVKKEQENAVSRGIQAGQSSLKSQSETMKTISLELAVSWLRLFANKVGILYPEAKESLEKLASIYQDLLDFHGKIDQEKLSQSRRSNQQGSGYASRTRTMAMLNKIREDASKDVARQIRRSGRASLLASPFRERSKSSIDHDQCENHKKLMLTKGSSTKRLVRTHTQTAAKDDHIDVHDVESLQLAFSGAMMSLLSRLAPDQLCTLLKSLCPVLTWWSTYNRDMFKKDFVASLAITAVMIPKAMAYTSLLGVPAVHGLYSILLPPWLYLIFGSSRHLGISMLSVPCLLAGDAVRQLDPPIPEEQYISVIMILGLIVGACYLVMAGLRCGFLLSFLSMPVLSGFTTAAAVVTILAQVKYLFGIHIKKSPLLHVSLYNLFSHLHESYYETIIIAVLGFIIAIACKMNKRTKELSFLVVVTLSIVFGYILQYDEMYSYGPDHRRLASIDLNATNGTLLGGNHTDHLVKHMHVAIVGKIPAGLQVPSLSLPSGDMISALIVPGLSVALIGFIETVAVGKIWATKFQYELFPNQELLALGFGNLAQMLVMGVPVMGSLSDTAASVASGTQSPVSICMRSLWILCVLYGATPLFYYLPKAILAVVVVLSVIKMVDLKTPRLLYRCSIAELAIWCVSCFATLFFGIQQGMVAAVLISLMNVLRNAAKGKSQDLGRVQGATAYRPLTGNDVTITIDGVQVFDFGAPLWHANCDALKNRLEECDDFDVAILDMTCVAFIDSTACVQLKESMQHLQSRDIRVFLCNVREHVMDMLEHTGCLETLMKSNGYIYHSLHEAVTAAVEEGDV